MKLADVDVHAVITRTDGDDGWVELFDDSGSLLAAARTYLECVAWISQSDARALTANCGFPRALADRVEVARAHRVRWSESLA